MFALLGLELNTLYRDRAEHDQEQALARCQQLQSFNKIATTLESAVRSSQEQFRQTMQQFSQTNKTSFARFSAENAAEQRRFNALVRHEERLAASLSGTLSPGTEPGPSLPVGCDHQESDVVLIYGNHHALVTDLRSFTVIRSMSQGPLLKLTQRSDGTLSLTGDVRSADGKILVRLDADGYVINHSGFLDIAKNRHSLRVVDDYGDLALDLEYPNPHTIVIDAPKLTSRLPNIRCFSIHRSPVLGSGIFTVP